MSDENAGPSPDHGVEIDAESRVVIVRYRRPLDIEAIEIEIPFAVWKNVAGVIITHEATMEAVAMEQAERGPKLWRPK